MSVVQDVKTAAEDVKAQVIGQPASTAQPVATTVQPVGVSCVERWDGSELIGDPVCHFSKNLPAESSAQTVLIRRGDTHLCPHITTR